MSKLSIWIQKNWLTVVLLAAVLLVFGYICAFKIIDRDFWWHLKAGQIMLQSHQLIKIDPFAYTRAGQPYISIQEWLAQIIFYIVYHAGGSTGTILLRTFLVAAAFIMILLIDRKTIWPHALVIIWAAYMNRPSFMDRPQLFTFFFFTCFLWAAFYYLLKARLDDSWKLPWRRWWLVALVLIQIVWVNVHGAAVVYGFLVIAALIGQRLVDWWLGAKQLQRQAAVRELKYLAIVAGALVGAIFISPTGWHTVHDVFTYTSDPTLDMVREWQPRGLGSYIIEIGPFWVLAAVALWLGRKSASGVKRPHLFGVLLLAVTGYLSFQAYRHGLIFIFTALGLAIYELQDSAPYQAGLAWLWQKRWRMAVGAAVVVIPLVWYMHHNDISELQREGYDGYGEAPVAKEAMDWVEQHNVQGNMFNTYAIGDYLLYRGYPNRKVFVDGRTIDYGYDFLYQVGVAGFDPAAWKKLEDKYGFTYAIIEYPLAPGASAQNDLPYVSHLAQNPDWKLVYIDDWVAVYLKDVPANKALIDQYGYKLLTPSGLEFGRVFDGLNAKDIPQAETELQRAADSSSDSIKARLLLAQHDVDVNKLDQALTQAQAAVAAQPYRPEAYEALGTVAAAQQQWAQAGALFEQSIALTGGVGLPINYAYLSQVFTNAGDIAKASYYHQKAVNLHQTQ